MIYLIFGEIGVGKNYVGKKLANELGYEFFDGDTVMPEKMAEKVAKFKALYEEDIDEFVFDNLIPAINKRCNAVVAQALYFKKHREAIVKGVNNKVRQIWIPAPQWPTHLARLIGRKKGVRWVIYGLLNKPYFQEPDESVEVIRNDAKADLNTQFEKFRKVVMR